MKFVWGTCAVLGVLAVGACGAPADDARGADRAVLTGADTPTSATPTTPVPTAQAPTDEGPAIDPELPPGQSPAPTPTGGQPWNADVSVACDQELTDEGHAGLSEVAQTADDHGVTSFWASGRRWAVCDMVTGADAASPVLVSAGSGTNEGLERSAFTLTRTGVPGTDGVAAGVRFVVGGPLPFPVQELTYRFPDRHTEHARFVRSDDGSTDTWWAVAYTVTDGVLVDPGTDPEQLEPLVVSVVGGAAEAFVLPWPGAS